MTSTAPAENEDAPPAAPSLAGSKFSHNVSPVTPRSAFSSSATARPHM